MAARLGNSPRLPLARNVAGLEVLHTKTYLVLACVDVHRARKTTPTAVTTAYAGGAPPSSKDTAAVPRCCSGNTAVCVPQIGHCPPSLLLPQSVRT
jgi:hypothetical protein